MSVEQETFYDAVANDKKMPLREKVYWLLETCSDYWKRLEITQAENERLCQEAELARCNAGLAAIFLAKKGLLREFGTWCEQQAPDLVKTKVSVPTNVSTPADSRPTNRESGPS
jgi:hypothetical protein